MKYTKLLMEMSLKNMVIFMGKSNENEIKIKNEEEKPIKHLNMEIFRLFFYGIQLFYMESDDMMSVVSLCAYDHEDRTVGLGFNGGGGEEGGK